MKNRSNHRISRERRKRIDALHRAFDADLRQAARNTGKVLAPPVLPPPQVTSANPKPLTLDAAVIAEMLCARAGRDQATLNRAKYLAVTVQDREPNAHVRAAFGVERAVVENQQGLPFDQAVPDCFVRGVPYVTFVDGTTRESVFRPDIAWQGMSREDLASLGRLDLDLDKVTTSGSMPACWRPQHPRTVEIADPMRPPMEAMALVATALLHDPILQRPRPMQLTTGPASLASVMCIGLGFAAAAQALSSMLLTCQVLHRPVPYVAEAKHPPLTPEAVVLGLPSAHAYQVASLLGGDDVESYLRRHEIRCGKQARLDPISHVKTLLRLAYDYRFSGRVLVVLGEPDLHHGVVRGLVEKGLVVPATLGGLDTSKQAIWIGYQGQAPWAPHRLPRPTGKVVSFWRWT